jgi:diguanylate cyclase (GGDEF)-like protein/PAS domain S-box-containing protein
MTPQIVFPAFEVESLDGPRNHLVVRVLVVDDNPIDRLRAGRLVEQDTQCCAIHASDGAEALERLGDSDIAMVLTDLQMAGMDGLELVRTIRKEHSQIPVILMTAHGSEDVAMEALRLGATDYVPKHRLSQELHAILARALRTTIAGRRRRRCLQSLVERQSQFELGNDVDLLPPLLEFLQDEMIQLGRWDSAELMRTTIAVDEALRNALYHGNLEVSSDLRQESDRLYHELARQRSTEDPYQDRRVRLMVAHGEDHSRFEIHDEGPGFDTSRVDRPIEPEDLLRPSGRGLLLMRSFMDSVVFNQAGNAVTLIKRRNGGPAIPKPEPPEFLTEAAAELPVILHPSACSPSVSLAANGHSAIVDGSGQTAPRSQSTSENQPLPLGHELYKMLLDQFHDAVCFVDPNGCIRYWNNAAERLTGHSSNEVVGRYYDAGWLDHLAPNGCSLRDDDCPMRRSMEKGRPFRERLFLRHKDGRRICVDVRIMPVRDREGTTIGGVEILCDATSSVVVESAYRQISEVADRDPLTGLANRRYLDRMLGRYLEQLERSGQPLSLIMSDLDHFKQINDTWGHVVGDKALVQYSTALQKQCRPVDLVARFGGEEFIVLLPGHSLETAVQIAERLRKCARLATPEDLGERRLTASFGVVQAAPGESAPQLLRRVDMALYRAKSRGRDRVEAESS